MASRDKFDVDMFHKSIQYALEKLGKSKSGFERTVVSKFKRKRRVGSGNELVDYSRAPCLGADQKARGLWERDCGDRERLRDFLLSMLERKGNRVSSNLVPSASDPLDPRSENECSGNNHFEINKITEITEFCPSGFTQSASMAHA